MLSANGLRLESLYAHPEYLADVASENGGEESSSSYCSCNCFALNVDIPSAKKLSLAKQLEPKLGDMTERKST